MCSIPLCDPSYDLYSATDFVRWKLTILWVFLWTKRISSTLFKPAGFKPV